MKILMMTSMYPSKSNMISGIFVHEQVRKLIEKGCEVRVVCPVPYVPFFLLWNKKWRSYANIPKVDLIEGVEVFYPRYIQFINGFLIHLSGYIMHLGIKNTISKIKKKFDFDLIHSHTVLPVGFSAMLLNKNYKLPFLITIHGEDLQGTIYRNEKCKNSVFKVLEDANKIVTVSNKLKRIIEKEEFSKKVVIISNGINPIEYTKDYSENMPFQNNILSVSSLIKTKGIDINIKAIYKLVDKYPEVKYYIIGSGEEEDNLRKLVSDLKLEKNIFFMGKQPHENVMEFMSKSKFFSLPSWKEGFGIVYIEAMAHGKPVIAIKGEGIEDVIVNGQNGFLIEPKNVESLVETLDFLLSNTEEAIRIGENARKSVLNHYTWEKNAENYISVYKKLIEG